LTIGAIGGSGGASTGVGCIDGDCVGVAGVVSSSGGGGEAVADGVGVVARSWRVVAAGGDFFTWLGWRGSGRFRCSAGRAAADGFGDDDGDGDGRGVIVAVGFAGAVALGEGVGVGLGVGVGVGFAHADGHGAWTVVAVWPARAAIIGLMRAKCPVSGS
jgi:hypothetical protein